MFLPGEQGSPMAQQQPARRKMQSRTHAVTIPDKLYFRIGDVARLCDLPAYVLRFWETEFPQLKPNKGGTGQRLYRKRDVEIVLEIKRLLYEDGFTIAGARKLLAEKRRHGAEAKPALVPAPAAPRATQKAQEPAPARAAVPTAAPTPRIKELREEMRELLAMLGPGAATGAAPARPKTPPPAARRETRKSRVLDEPTLF